MRECLVFLGFLAASCGAPTELEAQRDSASAEVAPPSPFGRECDESLASRPTGSIEGMFVGHEGSQYFIDDAPGMRRFVSTGPVWLPTRILVQRLPPTNAPYVWEISICVRMSSGEIDCGTRTWGLIARPEPAFNVGGSAGVRGAFGTVEDSLLELRGDCLRFRFTTVHFDEQSGTHGGHVVSFVGHRR